MEMNASKALELLSTVPEEEWIVNKYTDQEGKCCAIGHLLRLTSKNPTRYDFDTEDIWAGGGPIGDFVRTTVKRFNFEKHQKIADLSTVNNRADVNGYTEPVIKDRVLHLLRDMKEAGL